MLVDVLDLVPILRDPADPSIPIETEVKDGRVVAAYAARLAGREDFPVIAGRPILIDFTTSLVSRGPFDMADQAIEPHVRPPGRLRRIKQFVFGQQHISQRNIRRVMDTLETESKAKGASRPLVLILGGQTVGAGCKQLYDNDEIDLAVSDLWPSAATNLVADAHQIPFKDGSVDCIIIQAVLEHVLEPVQVVSEIHRVLRPDGLVYGETPFMQHVHEAAYDFTRWSERGHRWLFKAFGEIESGAIGGAGLTLHGSLQYVFAGLVRHRRLGAWMAAPFFWLRYLDALIPPSYALDSANGLYFFGRKQTTPLGAKELTAGYRGAQ